MFNLLKNKLGGTPSLTEEEQIVTMEQPDEREPEEILDDPTSSFELKKLAMQQIKDRYLKPREDNE
jgi:hypothetical protein